MEDMAELAMAGSLKARKKLCGAIEGHLEAPNPEQKRCNFMWQIFDRWLMWTEITVAALVVLLTVILLLGFHGTESEQSCCGLFQVNAGFVDFSSSDCSYDVLAEEDGTLTVSDYYDSSIGKTYKICNINGVECITSSGSQHGSVTLIDCINKLGLNTEYTSDDGNNFIGSDVCTKPWLEDSYGSSNGVLLFYGIIVIIMDTFAIIITLSMCQAELGRKSCNEDGCCNVSRLKRFRNIGSYYLWCCCCCYKGSVEKKEKGYKCAGRTCVVFTWLSTMIFSFLVGQAINGYITDSAVSNNVNISECSGGDDYILYDVSETADRLSPTAAVLEFISLIAFILVIIGFVSAMCPILKCWKQVPEAQAKEWEELVIKVALEENAKYGYCGWRGLCPCCCKKDGKHSNEETKTQMTEVVTKTEKTKQDTQNTDNAETVDNTESGNAGNDDTNK